MKKSTFDWAWADRRTQGVLRVLPAKSERNKKASERKELFCRMNLAG